MTKYPSEREARELKRLMTEEGGHDHDKIRALALTLDLSECLFCLNPLTFACIMNCKECVGICLDNKGNPHSAIRDMREFKRAMNDCFTMVLEKTRANCFDMSHFDAATTTMVKKQELVDQILLLQCHNGIHISELLDTIGLPMSHCDIYKHTDDGYKCNKCIEWMVQEIDE